MAGNHGVWHRHHRGENEEWRNNKQYRGIATAAQAGSARGISKRRRGVWRNLDGNMAIMGVATPA